VGSTSTVSEHTSLMLPSSGNAKNMEVRWKSIRSSLSVLHR
jgi:hypothetical protein